MYAVEKVTIGGIPTIRATRRQLARLMSEDHDSAVAGRLALPRIVMSSNGMVIATFHHDSAFRELVLRADIVDPDGMPLVFASRLFCKQPLVERTATTDFIHDAACAAVARGIRFYFLGGRPGVAQLAARKLRLMHPGLQVVGERHGYFPPGDEQAICAEIRRAGTNVLWVGLGSPRQEAFVVRNRSRLRGLTWLRTCGGLFDHVAGRFRRAPLWMQSSGLEWLFRLAQEPRRLATRYICTSPVAAYHLLTKTHD